jgi:uncharacterized protein (TIGR01777 family)
VKRVVVTGAGGLLGKGLLGFLSERFGSELQLVVLTRQPERFESSTACEVHAWDPLNEPAPGRALDGADAIVHLAGEPIAEGRWTPRKKQAIEESRIVGTRNLVRTLAQTGGAQRTLLCASASGYYGDRADELLDESSAPGTDFLASVCRAWEAEAEAASGAGVRVVRLRLGVVLAPRGGALERMIGPFQLGLGVRLGNGRQWMPWVHIQDALGLMGHALEHSELRGPVNVVARSDTNADFTQALASAVGRRASFSVPGGLLRLGLGPMADVLLASQRIMPRVAHDAGFSFRFDELGAALADCVRARGAGSA